MKLGPPKQRAVLALLLTHAGRPVVLHTMVDALWHEDPPATAVNVIHRHVAALRRLLEPELLSGTASRRLVRAAGGYRLDVTGDELDLLRFRTLRQEALRLEQGGDQVGAVALLVEALELWQGPAASGIPSEVRALAVFTAVDHERIAAVKEAAGFVLAGGGGLTERVLVALRRAASEHPLDEGLQARLIEVLAGAGRQVEALETYQAVRARIAEEIGLDPGPELEEARRAALGPTPPPRKRALPDGDAGAGWDRASTPAAVRPTHLPRDLDAFVGRLSELDVLETLIPGPGNLAQTVVISGMAGVGKTTLAVHWANRLADRFPDGQLYVDLRGFHLTGPAMSGAEAMRGLFDAFGVPVGRVPAGSQAQAALYRSLLTGRRVLVVLDNARDSEQVRPLLPASAGCLAVVTSRHQLQGLMAVEGAHSVTLSPLDEDDAFSLLARRLGATRVAQEAVATAEIIGLCGRLPLALAIVSARAALNPGYPLAAIAKELQTSHGSLDAFTGEPPLADARCVFSWSYRALSPRAARLFRLLALHPGPDCSVAACASLVALSLREARSCLAELVRAHLLFENEPGRFSSHSLLRAYATELVDEFEAAPDREEASARVLDHYLHSAHAAEAVLAPHRERITLRPPAAHTLPERFPDQRAAAGWFDRECPVLLAAVARGGRYDDGSFGWQLPAVLELYLDRNGRWQQQQTVQRIAIATAQRGGDVLGQAHGHRALGFALSRLGRWESADAHLELALRLFQELGDLAGQARVHRYGAFIANQHRRHADALEHYRHARRLYEAAGLFNGEASVHNEVGWTHLLLGENERAIEECGRALALHRRSGDRNGEAAAWDSLGVAHLRVGDHEQALDSLRHALDLYRRLGDSYLEADTLVHIADVHMAADRADGAAKALREALDILEVIGHPDAEGVRARILHPAEP
ncbi:BTAD domain-containing putative transcriptional regulator [Streptomyces sp. NPDC005576]|uniref:AfsR/SARP family transcriptional regulator n=1 Tax=Streptomyces sp. NPDC005576 TaxID=3364726 RepID=UPI0036CB0679